MPSQVPSRYRAAALTALILRRRQAAPHRYPGLRAPRADPRRGDGNVRSLLVALLAFPLALAPAEAKLGAHHRNVRASAYSGACDGSGSITADGHRPYYGVLAANWLPLGTLVRMDHLVRPRGHKPRRYFRVRDHGGANMNAGIDVFLNDCGAMNAWGVRRLSFRVVHH